MANLPPGTIGGLLTPPTTRRPVPPPPILPPGTVVPGGGPPTFGPRRPPDAVPLGGPSGFPASPGGGPWGSLPGRGRPVMRGGMGRGPFSALFGRMLGLQLPAEDEEERRMMGVGSAAAPRAGY